MTEAIKYTELINTVIHRLLEIWEAQEGDIVIEVRSDGKGNVKAKISGGKTSRIN